MKKKSLISLAVILIVIVIAVIILTRSYPDTSDDVAKCIGTRATLYIQLGCHACEIQEEKFGDSYEFISEVDCFFEREKCITDNIEATPTWIIDGEKYVGAKSVENIQKLTGC